MVPRGVDYDFEMSSFEIEALPCDIQGGGEGISFSEVSLEQGY